MPPPCRGGTRRPSWAVEQALIQLVHTKLSFAPGSSHVRRHSGITSVALSGLMNGWTQFPRALPWADEFLRLWRANAEANWDLLAVPNSARHLKVVSVISKPTCQGPLDAKSSDCLGRHAQKPIKDAGRYRQNVSQQFSFCRCSPPSLLPKYFMDRDKPKRIVTLLRRKRRRIGSLIKCSAKRDRERLWEPLQNR